MSDYVAIIICCVLGLVAHGSRRFRWLEWILRITFAISAGIYLCLWFSYYTKGTANSLNGILAAVLTCSAAGMLFAPLRSGLSWALSALDEIVSGQSLFALIKKLSLKTSLVAHRIFVPSSIPHMTALWLYVLAICILLSEIKPAGLNMPALPIPIPWTPLQVLLNNGLPLIVVSICGVGIFITRRPMAVLSRLGIVKPKAAHLALGIGMIVFTFLFDYLWSLYTHQQPGSIATQLSAWNAGSFHSSTGASGAAILAVFVALSAGIGEETLMRGALQPVFGILPAAFLHGALHGQFAHAPILIIQVAIWSTLMGVLRRYTNTTTTIIAHAGYNFLTTFLFAFNP